jgi:PPOX class probable F420-dependent enzyme
VATEVATSLIPDQARSFLTVTPPRYAIIGTINRDGSPHQTLIWFMLRGDELLVNSRLGRRWPANLRRDPRAHVAVYQRGDGVTLECEVERTYEGPKALADISAMAARYVEPDEAEELIAEWRKQQRITFILRPTRVHIHGDPD